LNFYDVAKELAKLKEELELLKDYYPLDIYSDETLGDKKSLTIRFTLQSDSKTLVDEDIEESMRVILNRLQESFNAELR
jgi:phenylalanyl-tRNA synthetase beta chain